MNGDIPEETLKKIRDWFAKQPQSDLDRSQAQDRAHDVALIAKTLKWAADTMSSYDDDEHDIVMGGPVWKTADWRVMVDQLDGYEPEPRDGCCPLCEEVDCDSNCPLSAWRDETAVAAYPERMVLYREANCEHGDWIRRDQDSFSTCSGCGKRFEDETAIETKRTGSGLMKDYIAMIKDRRPD